MTNEGQISYLKAYHRLGSWCPREAKDPARVRRDYAGHASGRA